GCPFDIVVQVDTVHGTPTQMRAAWTRAYGRRGCLGEAVLPLESGVQIEDEQGWRSNVLDGTRHISPQLVKSTCRDSARDPVELPTDWVVRASSTSSTGRDCETTLDHLRTLGTSAGALYQRAIGGPQ